MAVITLAEAKIHQDKLQVTAEQLLGHYQFEQLQAPLGELYRVGSFQYGLMVKPGIDFVIYNSNTTIEPLLTIANRPIISGGIGKVSVANHLI